MGFRFLVDWQRAQHPKKQNIIFYFFTLSLQLSLWCFTVSMNLNACASFSPNGNHCFLWGREEGLMQALSVERHWAQTWLPAWGGRAPAPSHRVWLRGHSRAVTHHGLLVCEGTPGLKHTLWHYCSMQRLVWSQIPRYARLWGEMRPETDTMAVCASW